jgi:branched-chain amino acid transport system ATP-binding protein
VKTVTQAIIDVKGVTKKFKGLLALSKVTFSIYPGEMLAIVGPNGSGKTTLFNVISGFYKPEGGSIIFDGKDVTNVPAYERAKMGIARSFQIPRPFLGATVRENVAVGALFGSLRGKIDVAEGLKIADATLELVGLGKKGSEQAATLTAPERKFLELARALAMKPKILLLDEVVAGMPPSTVDHVMDLTREVGRKENITVVALVEHVMRAVSRLAERTIVLHQGEKILDGPTREILSNPKVA